MSDPDQRSITLHSTWTGIVLSVLGAILLLVIAVVLASSGASWWLVGGFALVGVVANVVVVFDLPLASEFTDEGVTRRAIGRRQHLPWGRVTRLERHRVGVVRTRKDSVGGGLVAQIGGRRYTLVDTMENAIEFDELKRVLGPDLRERLGVEAMPAPPEGRSPTWYYRRSKWRPEL